MGLCKGENIPKEKRIKQYGKYGRSIAKATDWIPNSRTDFYDIDTGKLLQQRWYDNKGNAILDRDWDHNDPNHNHKFPHDHPRDHNKKPPRLDSVDYENKDFK